MGCFGSLTTRRMAPVDTAYTARNNGAARRTVKIVSRSEVSRRAPPHNPKNERRMPEFGVAAPVQCVSWRTILISARSHEPVARRHVSRRRPYWPRIGGPFLCPLKCRTYCAVAEADTPPPAGAQGLFT